MQHLFVYLYACRIIANAAAIPPNEKNAINHHMDTKPNKKNMVAQHASILIVSVSALYVLFIANLLSCSIFEFQKRFLDFLYAFYCLVQRNTRFVLKACSALF